MPHQRARAVPGDGMDQGPEGIVLRAGLAPGQRAAAAALYWEAFAGKLGRVMGPDARALFYLERVINHSHCLRAEDGTGALLGIAGFRSPKGAFAQGSYGDLRAVYGLAGAAWRAGLFRAFESEVDNDRFLVDGLCVARAARGRGIGRALLLGLCDLAAQRGYHEIRLDVIDTNLRAKHLYERLGFVSHGTKPIGLMRHAFGFDAATTMVRPLP